MDAATFGLLRSRLRHFHVHDEVLEPGNENILHLAKTVKQIDFAGYVSLEIIKGHNLPEDQLTETAGRLQKQIAQVFGGAARGGRKPSGP
jgi:sugar phosphate isomerase/epimerase